MLTKMSDYCDSKEILQKEIKKNIDKLIDHLINDENLKN